MAYSFSKRSTFFGCRKTYKARYIDKIRGAKTDPMMIGIMADEILEAIVAEFVAGEITKPSQIVPFMKTLIDDVEDMDGVITSHKQSAAWIIEFGLPKLKWILSQLKNADQVLTQEQLYFDAEWELLEQEDGEHIGKYKNRAVWGGDLDISWITGDEAHVHDWKSGKSRWSKPQQVVEYQAMLFQAYEGLTKVHGGLVWLAENKLEPVPAMRSWDVQQVIDRMQAEAEEIEAATEFECDGCFRCRSN